MSLISKRNLADQIAKRIFDLTCAITALTILSPVLIAAAIGITISSSGPIFFKAERTGKGGKKFCMFKLRTMHINSERGSAITSPGDRRVFRFGFWLRRLKIDELPQFWNIVLGDMSLVGPRPEDPRIVETHYKDWMHDTLLVLPGLTGPGSVYGYVFGDQLLHGSDPEESYVRNVLPPKLALERAYMERATLFTDIGYMILTAWSIIAVLIGWKVNISQKDICSARQWAPKGPYPNLRE